MKAHTTAKHHTSAGKSNPAADRRAFRPQAGKEEDVSDISKSDDDLDDAISSDSSHLGEIDHRFGDLLLTPCRSIEVIQPTASWTAHRPKGGSTPPLNMDEMGLVSISCTHSLTK